MVSSLRCMMPLPAATHVCEWLTPGPMADLAQRMIAFQSEATQIRMGSRRQIKFESGTGCALRQKRCHVDGIWLAAACRSSDRRAKLCISHSRPNGCATNKRQDRTAFRPKHRKSCATKSTVTGSKSLRVPGSEADLLLTHGLSSTRRCAGPVESLSNTITGVWGTCDGPRPVD